MIKYLKKYKEFVSFCGFLVENNKRLVSNWRLFAFHPNSSQARLFSVFQSRGLLVTNNQCQLIISRNKSKRKKKNYGSTYEENSDEEEEENELYGDDDYPAEEGAQLKEYKLNSLRTDLVLKTVLGISRANIEKYFYKNKIRINGNVVFKKSQNVQKGDEIDIIMKIEDQIKNTINVSRVKILAAKSDSDSGLYVINVLRFKSLTIKNYEGVGCWKETEELN